MINSDLTLLLSAPMSFRYRKEDFPPLQQGCTGEIKFTQGPTTSKCTLRTHPQCFLQSSTYIVRPHPVVAPSTFLLVELSPSICKCRCNQCSLSFSLLFQARGRGMWSHRPCPLDPPSTSKDQCIHLTCRVESE